MTLILLGKILGKNIGQILDKLYLTDKNINS